jgi:pimeloyl-ACP methyl ester carboxylesterase
VSNIQWFKMPGNVAEAVFLKDDGSRLRGVYQGKVPDEQVSRNLQRLLEPGALTATLNWYRALDLDTRIGHVCVPTLYVWGDEDMALGRSNHAKSQPPPPGRSPACGRACRAVVPRFIKDLVRRYRTQQVRMVFEIAPNCQAHKAYQTG